MISHQRSERLQSEFAILSESRSVAVDALHAATAIYTATEVVRSLLQRANWPHRGGRLIDPSAGDGAFMVEALAMLDLSAEQLLESDRVVGMEIHRTRLSLVASDHLPLVADVRLGPSHGTP